MSTLKRFIASGPGALLGTVGLGVLMANLIAVPYTQLPDKEENLSFVIKEMPPEVVIEKHIEQPTIKVVVPPPAAPVLDIKASTLPQEDIGDFTKALPDFEIPDLVMTKVDTVSDQSGGPTVRIPPIMPTRAERSGHCDMMYDVNADGVTYNVRTVSCSQTLFSRSSVKAVQKWKYRPQISGGQARGQSNIRTTITFNLNDEHGKPIPE